MVLLIAAAAFACACASGSSVSPDGGGSVDGMAAADADPAAPDALVLDAPATTADAAITIDAAPASPDATPASPDAAPPTPDAAPPDACVPQWVQLLGNSDFEAGNTVWSATSNGGDVIRMGSSPWPPHGGSWQALFLGYNNASQTLSQTVTVPANATALRLRGQRCFVTDETSTTTPYDNLTVELKEGPTLLETLASYSNLDAGSTCSWTALQFNATASHAGKNVTVHMIAGSDASTATSFGLDTLIFEAFACQ